MPLLLEPRNCLLEGSLGNLISGNSGERLPDRGEAFRRASRSRTLLWIANSINEVTRFPESSTRVISAQAGLIRSEFGGIGVDAIPHNSPSTGRPRLSNY